MKARVKLGSMVQVSNAEFPKIKNDIAVVIEEMEPSEETGDMPLYRIEYFNRNSLEINFDALPRWWPAEDLKVIDEPADDEPQT